MTGVSHFRIGRRYSDGVPILSAREYPTVAAAQETLDVFLINAPEYHIYRVTVEEVT